MSILDGSQFGDMLMNVKGSCPKCGTSITFEEGAGLAKQRGIKENVVLCKHCQSIYMIELSPRAITFVADVTDKYLPQKDPQIKVELPEKDHQPALPQQQPTPSHAATKSRACKKCGQLVNFGEYSCPNCGAVMWDQINAGIGGGILGLAILALASYYAFNSHSVFWIVIAVIFDLICGSIYFTLIRQTYNHLIDINRSNRIRKSEQASVQAEISCPSCGHRFVEARAVATTQAIIDKYGPNPVKCPNCNHVWGQKANVVSTYKV